MRRQMLKKGVTVLSLFISPLNTFSDSAKTENAFTYHAIAADITTTLLL